MVARSIHVLSAIHRVEDFGSWWSQVSSGRAHLTALGTRRLMVYRAFSDPNQVYFAMGIPAREPLDELLRSGLVLEWFDLAGVEDVPPVFVGQDMISIKLVPHGANQAPDDIIVATVAWAPDPEGLVESIRELEIDLREVGILQVWLTRAIDDAHELLIVLGFRTEAHASAWTTTRSILGTALSRAQFGDYAPVFTGKLGGVLEPVRTE